MRRCGSSRFWFFFFIIYIREFSNCRWEVREAYIFTNEVRLAISSQKGESNKIIHGAVRVLAISSA